MHIRIFFFSESFNLEKWSYIFEDKGGDKEGGGGDGEGGGGGVEGGGGTRGRMEWREGVRGKGEGKSGGLADGKIL